MRGYHGKLPDEVGQPVNFEPDEQEDIIDPELPVCDMVMEEREVTAVTRQPRLVPIPAVQRFTTEPDIDVISNHILNQIEEHMIKHYGESEQ